MNTADQTAVRSRIMAAIRSKDTAPELRVRRALHSHGLRYRIHDRSLPGSPDIVLPYYGSVILVEGCFWHGHLCGRVRVPPTTFWQDKIRRNRQRDEQNITQLRALGWRICRIWDCALAEIQSDEYLAILIMEWILSGNEYLELARSGWTQE